MVTVSTEVRPLTDKDALYGAAYRVVFERVGNPDRCTTPEQLAIVSAIVGDIRGWSTVQESDVAMTYGRACTDILARASTVVENNRRTQRMISLYDTIPKPPLPTDKAT